MTITERETQTYAEALTLPHYADFSPGERYADLFASIARPGATVLDAGCGTGKGLLALAARGFRVYGCDLTDVGLMPEAKPFPVATGVSLWRPIPMIPREGVWRHSSIAYDWVYCTDVLEHIPPAFTMLVVHQLLAVASGVFLSISLVPDHFGAWLGTPLHLSVRRFDEWRDDFAEIACVREARDLGTNAVYILEPRR